MKRWITLFSIVGVIFFGAWLCAPTGKYERRFELIESGMTLREVENILGPAARGRFTPINKWSSVYRDGWKQVQVDLTLDNDFRVVDKQIKVEMRDGPLLF